MTPRQLLAALILGTSAGADAQSVADSTVRLARRSFIPRPGIDAQLLPSWRRDRYDRVHVLVQFRRPPNESVRASLRADMRIQVLSAVSDRLFLGTLLPGPALRERLPSTIRWIGAFRPTDKLGVPVPSPRAAASPFVVQFFEDVDTSDQRAALARHGAQRFGRIDMINGWMITLSPDSLLPLAAEDAVMWIEGPPQARQFDNDIARSGTGVNAEVVRSPATYALSGAGTTIGYWDGTIPSLQHQDFSGRVNNADGTIIWRTRNVSHVETGAVAQFDPGEELYVDMDDSRTVSLDDLHLVGPTLVRVGPATPGIGSALALFNTDEVFVDDNGNALFDNGEPIYRDADADGKVTNAVDVLVTGTPASDGKLLTAMARDLHAHSTLVVGSILGSGALSVAESGTALQWMGIAPDAKASARAVCKVEGSCMDPLWLDAFNNELRHGAALSGIAGFAHPWGPGGCNELVPPAVCYMSPSQIYDVLANGRVSSGASALLPALVLTIGSAGNTGWPERHTDDVTPDGKFEAGESIYRDSDGNFVVSNGDVWIAGPVQQNNAPLVDFQATERHVTTPGDRGRFLLGQGIYRDVDGSGTITANDERLLVSTSVGKVNAGDADEQTRAPLRQFALWGNVQLFNDAKNTLQVGAVPSDAVALPPWSSRGPTSDGRLKPDLVAPGTRSNAPDGVTSPSPRNVYGVASGTSMSTGVAAGSVALLAEWYKRSCVAAGASPATLRALLIHGADDVVLPVHGAGAGPDYASGYGRLRVREAVDLAPHHATGTLSLATPSYSLPITIARTQPLRVTLAWSDVPWTVLFAPTSHGILQNDLDLLLIAPDGTQYGPWLLDPALPASAATRRTYPSGAPVTAGDHRNTIEQVVVDDAQPGTWTIKVSSSQMNRSPQPFTLVSEAIPPTSSPCVTTPAADVWVRDNDTDVGTVPSSGAMYLGPDLWNRTANDGGTAHENPEYGQQNYLYVNVRNRSAVAVSATTAELWIANAATGLIWPTSYTYVGRIMVPNLGPNEVRQVGPLAWMPPGAGHFCMYLRLLSPQDPITIAQGNSIWANAQGSNNIAYRNLNIVDLHSSRSVSFLVRNTELDSANVDIVLRVPPAFLAAGTVRFSLSDGLARSWTQPGRARGLTRAPGGDVWTPSPAGQRAVPVYIMRTPELTLSGFGLRRGQGERMTITFSSTSQQQASHDVDVLEQIGGRVVGGIRYVVRTGQPPP